MIDALKELSGAMEGRAKKLEDDFAKSNEVVQAMDKSLGSMSQSLLNFTTHY